MVVFLLDFTRREKMEKLHREELKRIRFWEWIAVFIILATAFLLRSNTYHVVFVDGEIIPQGTDAFYYLRHIWLTVLNYPHVPEFDYYVNFPDNGWIMWAEGYTLLLATFAKIVGLWHPTKEMMWAVAVWSMPFLGTLTVLLLHYFGRSLFNLRVALISASILAIAPIHYSVSMLGNVDHHVMEPLLLLLIFLGLGKGMMSGHRRGFEIMTGMALALGCYLWTGAYILIAFYAGFFVFVRIIEALLRRYTAEIYSFGERSLAIALIVVIPVILSSHWGRTLVVRYYVVSWFHFLAVLAAFIITAIFSAEKSPALRPFAWAAGILFLVSAGGALYHYDLYKEGFDFLFRKEAVVSTVTEYTRLFDSSFVFFTHNFSYLALFTPVFVLLLIIRMMKTRFSEISSTLVLYLTLTTSALGLYVYRFSSYFMIPFGLLIGIIVGPMVKRSLQGMIPLALLTAILFPTLLTYTDTPKQITGMQEFDLYREPLNWIREHTPPTSGLYDLSKRPEYAVLAEWTPGFWINIISERPNIANPFSQAPWHLKGIRDRARFIFMEEESEAFALCSELGAKYVITVPPYYIIQDDAKVVGKEEKELSDYIGLRGDDFIAGKKFFNLFYNRLHYLNGMQLRRTQGGAAGHYRLVHESSETIPFGSSSSTGLPSTVSQLKIFEVVKGGAIRGRIEPGATVTARLLVETNTGRKFTYSKYVYSDNQGFFEIYLPYPTGYSENVCHSLGPYQVSSGDRTVTVDFTEQEIREGATKEVTFVDG